jgi:cytochrome c-type biogenesis protein CcmF
MYLFTALRGKIQLSGASLAHAGFGIMLVGILISGARQQVISRNSLGIDYGEAFDLQFKQENILLYQGMPQRMGDYRVTYLSDTAAGDATYYRVQYEVLDAEGRVTESFVLEPYLLRDKKTRQLSPNPATRHYLSRDLFTHVSAVPNEEQAPQQGPKINTHTVELGDTVYFGAGLIRVESVVSMPPLGDTIRAGLRLFVESSAGTIEAIPELRIAAGRLVSPPFVVAGVPLQLLFRNVTPETGQFELATVEPRSANDWIILKAIIFPQIRLVWLGSIVLFAGIAVSIVRRRALNAKHQQTVA